MRQSHRKQIAIFALLTCIPPLFISCFSLRDTEITERSVEELQAVKETLGATHFKPCETLPKPLTMPVPIRTAQILWHDDNPALVYEGVFREAVKSIWQSLKTDFTPTGDGVVIGQKEMPFVTDFSTSNDDFQGFWTLYRFKVPHSEILATAVEYLPKEKSTAPIIRLGMPQARDTSVQRAWIIPLPQPSSPATLRASQKGLAHIIVRTVAITDSNDEVPESTYTWYLLHASKNLVKKMGEYRTKGGITIERFLLSRETNDPIAIGLYNDNDDTYSTNAKAIAHTSRIVAMRPFQPGNPTSILHEDDTNSLSNLTVHSSDGAIDTVHLAWVREPATSSRPSLQYVTTRIEVPGKLPPPATPRPVKSAKSTDKRKGGKKKVTAMLPPLKTPKPTLPLRTLALGYVPSSLSFLVVPPQPTPLLSWWGGADDTQGLVLLPMDNKETLPSHAFVPREALGQPLGVSVPPASRPEGLVMYFGETNGASSIATPGKVRLCTVPRALLQN